MDGNSSLVGTFIVVRKYLAGSNVVGERLVSAEASGYSPLRWRSFGGRNVGQRITIRKQRYKVGF